MFIHGLLDKLISVKQTQDLIKQCKCPYEVVFPELMDHNNFSFDADLKDPLIEFLYRHTEFNSEEKVKIVFPPAIFKIPKELKEGLKESEEEEYKILSCFT